MKVAFYNAFYEHGLIQIMVEAAPYIIRRRVPYLDVLDVPPVEPVVVLWRARYPLAVSEIS